MRRALEPLLYEYGVDIMFAGCAACSYIPRQQLQVLARKSICTSCDPPGLAHALKFAGFLWLQAPIDVSAACRHVHAYERCNRVYNYSVDPCGPVSITVGDGGAHCQHVPVYGSAAVHADSEHVPSAQATSSSSTHRGWTAGGAVRSQTRSGAPAIRAKGSSARPRSRTGLPSGKGRAAWRMPQIRAVPC